MNKSTSHWLVAPLALAALMTLALPAAAQAGRQTLKGPAESEMDMTPNTGNTSPASNWRLDPNASFNGVANAFNGTARLSMPGWTCSGSLLAGGEYVLTAAHCVEGAASATIRFGLYGNVALETRTATAMYMHPGWIAGGGMLDDGSDIALIKLSAPVTNLNAYYLSDTRDVGREYIITGYGSTRTGYGTNSADSGYGHYGYNVIDEESSVVYGVWGLDAYVPPTYGATYTSDFDSWTNAQGQMIADPDRYNTFQRIADIRGSDAFTSGLALGAQEALIASGDSGGGDFVWDEVSGNWVLTAVHSWGWDFCNYYSVSPNCSFATGASSYGHVSGSTATYSHIQWIESIVGYSVTVPVIPEPSTYALMALGLAAVGGMARRRRKA